MASYTQANRAFAINTPLGTDKLLLTGFTGEEGLSKPYSFQLDVLAELAALPQRTRAEVRAPRRQL